MYKRILVPLDGSKEAEHAIPHVKTAATGYEPPATVIVFHAIKPQYLSWGSEYASTEQLIKEEREFENSSKQYINTITYNLKNMGINAEDAIFDRLTGQDVAEEILHYADGENIDLIVMTTHGRSGIKRWAFGSVTDKVVRHSKVPVLVVPPHGYRESK